MIPNYLEVNDQYTNALEALAASPILDFGPDDDGSIPANLRAWLVRLRLLDGVPFANLVADSELLPPESMRWFYLDRRWTDAAVQGALSVGTVNTDDRIQLDAQYLAIRAELDIEERNQRLATGVERSTGDGGPISGFLLRSEAVSGWPGLHVRAFAVDPGQGADDTPIMNLDAERVQLLRLERLAPAVLLCLFDGIPEVVHIEEPRQGIQFGFRHDDTEANTTAKLPVRDQATFEYLDDGAGDELEIDVRFRPGSAGVVDIQQLERDLADIDETTPGGPGASDGLDSAEYALQLVRFPWRQVFGDTDNPPPDLAGVFKPTISYVDHSAADRVVRIGPVERVGGR